VDFRTGNISSTLPLVTIAVSSYNYSMYIEAALDSVLAQTYQHIELIIIDDCSTDKSVDIIEKWINKNNVQCIFIVHIKNKGISATLNEMVKESTGEYFVMFASDDIMRPERIERQVNMFKQTCDSYGLCYSPALFMDENSNKIEYPDFKLKKIINGDAISDFIRRQFNLLSACTMIRTGCYEQVGYYDERVLIEDYNFFIRLLAKYKVVYCDYAAIIYRIKYKNVSPVFELANRNGRERYYLERIISNNGAYRYLLKAEDKTYIRNKNIQYLKTLAINNSGMFWKAVFLSFCNGHITIPPKVFFLKLKAAFL
jgi:glycosyltransferase involved in cell wall biosynthesis